MKLRDNQIDQSSIGTFEDEIKSSIAAKDLGLALTMVSKNLYSNPIGSFIRELVSNGHDANIDAKEESPVLVHIYREDDIIFMEVKDNGVGMSPTVFKEVYMSWFNSDKRDTNEKIGGWGLGSKSPLAYQDSFEIITRYDGKKYHYIFANGDELSGATLMLEEETSEGNGTTIRVEIKDEDSYKVHQECVKQLCYFDNVYVKDEIWFYDNKFQIFETDDFKLRDKNYPFGNEMHICLGQVAYPIDWNKLNLRRVNIPVGIKFKVGELDVTLSREEINYTKATEEHLLKVVTRVTDKLLDKYEKQLQVTDLFEYVRATKNDKRPPLIIGDVEVPMEGARANVTFTPFEGLTIKAKDITHLFSAYNVTHLKSGKKYQMFSDSYRAYYNLWRNPSICYLVRNKINYYDTLYINNGYLFSRGKITKTRFKRLASILNLVEDSGMSGKPIIKYGSAKIIKKVLEYIDRYLINNIEQYEGTAPKEWIEEIKAKDAIKKEKTKGEITFYTIHNNRSTVKIKDLIEDYKFVFYINKQLNKKEILSYSTLYDLGNKQFKSKCLFIIISPTTITKIKKYNNIHHVSSIFKVGSYRNLLRALKLSKIVKEELKPFNDLFVFSTYYSKLYNTLYNTYRLPYKTSYYDIPTNNKEVLDFEIDVCSYFKTQIDNTILNKNKTQLIYEEYIPILKELIDKGKILNYIAKSVIPHNTLVDFISSLKILKLNEKYYHKEKNQKNNLVTLI